MRNILCLIVLCGIASTVFGDDVLTSRQGGRRRKSRACRYQKGEWSDCNQDTQMMTRTLTLKRGNPNQCEPTKEMSLSCQKVEKKLRKRACKYSKGDWSDCDPLTNKRSRTLTLRLGETDQCEPTKTILRKCKKLKRRQKKKKLAASKGAKGCKYQLGEWTDCDTKTNTRSRTLTLRSGDVQLCQQVKVFYRKCKKPCKFKKGQWSECDMVMHIMERIDTLTAGNDDFCESTRKITKKCGRKQNTDKKIKSSCKYDKGDWTECDAETKLMERVDTLTGVNDNFCEPSRKITKKCGKKQDGGGRLKSKCKYQIGNWSDCDPDTNLRSRVKQLVSGDSTLCQEEKVFTKSCARPNGKERCFFGDWGDYAPCQNGVMKKQRPVLQGGIECQRRGVKTKPCHATSLFKR